jgi:RNA-directed DNA polymerase
VKRKMTEAPEPKDKLDAATMVVVNGPEDTALDWHAIDWRRVEDEVRRLRQRIFTASKAGDLARVRNLQKLMLRSRANTLLSVRRVTERNAGRMTAGVDGEVVLSPEAKANLVDRVQRQTEPFTAMPVRRVYIPKQGSSTKRRPLGIPVILDRCHQARVVSALEPEWEAMFEPRSYGFRPGRGCHDAIDAIYRTACGVSTKRRWVLDADLAAAFDKIAHDHILAMLGTFPATGMIRAWLKAGVVEHGRLHRTEEGTPQGGVVSPVLLNVALHGMEKAAGVRYHTTGRAAGWAVAGTPVLIRYADDCVSRTLKEDRCRRRFCWMRCCSRDEGAGLLAWWPFAVALQGEIANHREVRRSRAGVLSVAETARCQRVRCGSRRRAKAIPPRMCRKRIGDIQNRGRVVAPGGAWREPADWPGGCPAWMVARA